MIFFPDKFRVCAVRLPANSIPPEDPIMKAWEYGMITYFLKIPNPKKPILPLLRKFQKYIFKRIHQVFTSSESPTKFTYKQSIDIFGPVLFCCM